MLYWIKICIWCYKQKTMKTKKKITVTNYLVGEITYAMQNSDNYELTWYLDIEDEKVIMSSIETMDQDEIEELEQNADRYIPIPQIFSGEKWEDMRDFISDLDVDDTVRNLLLSTIRGSGAFRRFEDAVVQIGKLDAWHEYSHRIDCKKTLDWLLYKDLIDKEDVEKGMRLHDEAVEMRKQKERELEQMQAGSVVQCTYNTGHEGKITVGNQYKVTDEKPQHLMIRIKNDENQLKWYPKAHFDLVEKKR